MTELVRAVRALLDTLPEEEVEEAAEAGEEREQRGAAPAPLPGRRDTAARIGEFTIEADLAGPRVWFVQVGWGCGQPLWGLWSRRARVWWLAAYVLASRGGRGARAGSLQPLEGLVFTQPKCAPPW